MTVQGIDVEGTPNSFIKLAGFTYDGKLESHTKEPFRFSKKLHESPNHKIRITLTFMKHYEEPDVVLDYEFSKTEASTTKLYVMKYNPLDKVWTLKGNEVCKLLTT